MNRFRTLAACLLLLAAGAAAAAQYTYDELNRLTKVTYDDGRSIAYTYDAAGNLLKTEATVGLNSGLVGHWSFDACNAQDGSPNANHGAISGAPVCVPGKFGNALRFNGSTDWIVVPNSPSFPSKAITLSYWLHREGNALAGTLQNYLSKELSFQSYLMLTGALTSGVWLGSPGLWTEYGSTAIIPTFTDWVHYAFTYDNATRTAKTYLNGVLADTKVDANVNALVRASNNALYIGRNGSANVYRIKGLMDEVRIYDRALSSAEIGGLVVGTNLFRGLDVATSTLCGTDCLGKSTTDGDLRTAANLKRTSGNFVVQSPTALRLSSVRLIPDMAPNGNVDVEIRTHVDPVALTSGPGWQTQFRGVVPMVRLNPRMFVFPAQADGVRQVEVRIHSSPSWVSMFEIEGYHQQVEPPPAIQTSCPSPVKSVQFTENFATTLDPARWTVLESGGTVRSGGGSVTLSTVGSKTQFPSISTVNDVIPATGNFSLFCRAKYSAANPYGGGACVATQNLVAASASANYGGYIGVWGGGGAVYAWGFDVNNQRLYYAEVGSGINEQHDYETCVVNGEVSTYIDGVLAAKAAVAPDRLRPRRVWLGHPGSTVIPNTWVTIETSRIEVRQLQ